MRRIERGEILGLAEYDTVRDRFRARVIAEKKLRRVPLGPKVTALFENRDTVMMQIQEMLRTERITRPAAVQHEIDTYNELVPGKDELSCTVMVEISDKEEREAFLRTAAGLERHVWLVAGSQRIAGRAPERTGAEAERTTAVHYFKFPLPSRLADALRAAASASATITHLEIVVDHPAYEARVVLPAETILELGQDLQA